MRKYCPRVRLVRRPSGLHLNSPGRSLEEDSTLTTKSFLLSECVFITVTAYQNQLVYMYLTALSFFYNTSILTVTLSYCAACVHSGKRKAAVLCLSIRLSVSPYFQTLIR